jgi:MoaA/NifB/PqqE/SkfB family radical SAM enzyme
METYNDNPNFSIIATNKCNADCKFCFVKKNKKVKDSNNYITSLEKTLDLLPEAFSQISITGGEPLISPSIREILGVVRDRKKMYPNVVLTTNGTNLLNLGDEITRAVDHVNISRHHYDEQENIKLFGGCYDVGDSYVESAINTYSKFGVDISCNCVVSLSTKPDFILNFIKWARSIGFISVHFRAECNDYSMTPLPVDEYFNDHKVLAFANCPCCSTKYQSILGYNVYWKYSIPEPSEVIPGVFELVFNVDGKAYKDWNCKKEIYLVESDDEEMELRRKTEGGFSCGIDCVGQRILHAEKRSKNSCGQTRGCG